MIGIGIPTGQSKTERMPQTSKLTFGFNNLLAFVWFRAQIELIFGGSPLPAIARNLTLEWLYPNPQSLDIVERIILDMTLGPAFGRLNFGPSNCIVSVEGQQQEAEDVPNVASASHPEILRARFEDRGPLRPEKCPSN